MGRKIPADRTAFLSLSAVCFVGTSDCTHPPGFRPMLRLPLCFLSLVALVLVSTTRSSAGAAPALPPPEPMDQFVTRRGDQLVVGDDVFRFVSVNLPDVLQIITNYRFDNEDDVARYRVPNAFEQRDALRSVRQLGGRVARTFVITCSRNAEPTAMFHLSDDAVVPNEAALLALDRLLQIGREEGIRLIVPLIAYKSALRGDPSTYGPDFWTVGSADNRRFKAMLTQLLGRTNSLTGRAYRDDPTVLGWQTGNELVIGDDPVRRHWLHDIAATLKTLAPHQLLIDGRNKPQDVYDRYDEFAADPNLDAVSYHTYVNLPEADSPAGTLRLIRAQLRGRKPLLLTEVAMYTKTAALRALLDEIAADGTVGAQWWGLRFHNRDGGFYKHSDRGSKFEDLNWPGFPVGAEDTTLDTATTADFAHEREVLAILHDYAARLSGRAPVPVTPPAAPTLLPATDVAHLTWQGAAGATGYDVQRAPTNDGPWTTLVPNLDDHRVPYDALFCDHTAALRIDNFYRVIARNAAGASIPSNIIGPLRTDRHWLVDDQVDATAWAPESTNLTVVRTYLHGGNLEGVNVAQRADAGQPGRLVYRVPGALRNFTVFAYATAVSPRFELITAAGIRTTVSPQATHYQGDRRTRYDFTLDQPDVAELAIELPSAAPPAQAIGRVELAWTPAP